MISSHMFIILFSSFIFYQSIHSQSITLLVSTTPPVNIKDNSTITNITNQANSTTSVYNITNTVENTTVNSSTTSKKTTLSSTVSTSTITTNQTTTSGIDLNNSPKPSSRSNWGLAIAAIVTLAVLVIIGFIYYQRNTPYRRFLRNWRARDNEADNIILQLEQPDIITDQRWRSELAFN